jgi:multiple sugar transport system ATP-binding protein
MDEPLSNLDALLRMQMRAELKALLHRLGTTTVYVTHDQVEALSMGDRVAVMRAGRIAQIDSPLAVYDHPADTYVGGFIGTPPMNFLPAAVVAADEQRVVQLSGGRVRLPAAQMPGDTTRPLLLGIRAESVQVELAPADNLLSARVVVTEPLGSHNLLTVRAGTDVLKVSAPADLFLPLDRDVWLRLDPQKIRWMDRETGAALRPTLRGEDRSRVDT